MANKKPQKTQQTKDKPRREPWDDIDFLQALDDVRDELSKERVDIDPDAWIAELDAE